MYAHYDTLKYNIVLKDFSEHTMTTTKLDIYF